MPSEQNNAGWCRACGRAVWLPHEEHADSILIEYRAGKKVRIGSRRPDPLSVLDVKAYRYAVASRLMDAGGEEEAVSILEDLLPFVDREGAAEDEALLDHEILADLALGLIRLWRLDAALAVLGRAPLNARRLDPPRLRALGYRSIAQARLGELFYAKQDRERLYSYDPRHPLLDVIDEEILKAIALDPGRTSRGAAQRDEWV